MLTLAPRLFAPPKAARPAWIAWGLLLVVAVSLVLTGSRRSVAGNYREGAWDWIRGHALYDGSGAGFIYFPQAAITYIPVALLPPTISEAVWRFVTLGLFVAGIWRLAQLAGQGDGRRHFPLMTLVSIPLAWSALRNGQSTLPMCGLMMMAVADLAQQRWSKATLWLCLAFTLKPLAIVLILLAAALHAPMRLRLALGMAVVMLFPFLTQRPEYVMSQYMACLDMLRTADRVGDLGYWAQLFGILKVAGYDTPEPWDTLTRLVAAVATLGLCYAVGRRHSADQAHLLIYVFTAIYLMLFNPRTENNTYAALAPAIGALASLAIIDQGRWLRGTYYLGCGVVILCSYEVGKLFVPPVQAVFLAPLGCLAFSVPVVIDALRCADPGIEGEEIDDGPMIAGRIAPQESGETRSPTNGPPRRAAA